MFSYICAVPADHDNERMTLKANTIFQKDFKAGKGGNFEDTHITLKLRVFPVAVFDTRLRDSPHSHKTCKRTDKKTCSVT